MYIPMLDNIIIMDIMDHFSNQLTDFLELNIFIPSSFVNINDEVLKQN
jgi:hypothetical protein